MDSHLRVAAGPWAVRYATFALGASSLGAQVVVVRSGLVAFGGNELVLAFLFGWWLLAVGVGAFAGGFILKRPALRAERYLAAVLLLFAAVLPPHYFVARGLRGIVGLPAGQCPELTDIAWGSALAACPVSFLVGLTFPLLAASRRAAAFGTGEVYGLEAVGSLAGALVGTYAFLAWGREELLVFSGTVLLLAAPAFLWRRKGLRLAAGGVLLLWCAVGPAQLRSLAHRGDALRWRGLLAGFRLIDSAETPYGNLAVLGGQGQYQLYLNGQLAFAFPDPFSEEIEAHVAATEAPQLRRIVVLGGRPGLVRELRKYRPKELVLVRLDPAVETLLEPFLDPATRKALNEATRIVEDPRRFLRKERPGQCDLLLIALPQPSSVQLNRFYTVDFFREAKRVLSPRGVVAFSIDVGLHLKEVSAGFAGACLRTLREVFPDPVFTAVPAVRFFASPTAGVVTTDKNVLARRFNARGISTERFLGFYFWGAESFRRAALAFTRRQIEPRASQAAAERDTQPALFLRYLRLVAQRAESSLDKVLALCLRLKPQHVLPWALLPGLFVFAFRRRKTTPVLIALLATGGWGMALEIVVLFAFQILAGSLYYKIGLVVGAFMCGLALGALRGRLSRGPGGGLLGAEAFAAGIAFLTPSVLGLCTVAGSSAAQGLLCVWVGFAGAVTGYEFSVANLFLAGPEPDRRRTWIIAALTDGADHLGACVGASLTALFLLPALGTTGTALFLGALKAATLAGLWRGGVGPIGR